MGLPISSTISSDKAVRPSGVMGMTKRVAELLIDSLRSDQTKYVAVRFGNVLGSNGSVIPLFKSQIAAGRARDRDPSRDAPLLYDHSRGRSTGAAGSTMGKGGEIFVLDMGEQIKILDLARNLILLSGLRPYDDIQIEFTGMRPGGALRGIEHPGREHSADLSRKGQNLLGERRPARRHGSAHPDDPAICAPREKPNV